MEGFDFSKIASVVIFGAIYLFLQWRSHRDAAKGGEHGEAEILEEFDFESFDRELHQSPKPSVDRVVKRAPARTAEKVTQKMVEPKPSKEDDSESPAVDFDLRKAVIMSEILTPKFKSE